MEGAEVIEASLKSESALNVDSTIHSEPLERSGGGKLAAERRKPTAGSGASRECTSGAEEVGRQGGQFLEEGTQSSVIHGEPAQARGAQLAKPGAVVAESSTPIADVDAESRDDAQKGVYSHESATADTVAPPPYQGPPPGQSKPPAEPSQPASASTTKSVPESRRRRTRTALPDNDDEEGLIGGGGEGEPAADHGPGRWRELKRFTLWETRTRYYMVAYNASQTRFRILKLDRTVPQPRQAPNGAASQLGAQFSAGKEGANADPSDTAATTGSNIGSGAHHGDNLDWDLNITTDRVVYARSQITELLDMIAEGNRSTGGLKEVGRFFGIVGFIRFTSGYYMVLVSRRSVVALLGGHYIYHCDETKVLPVCHPSALSALPGRSKARDYEEARLLQLFRQVDLGKNFYFSYSYDLTRTLQSNLTRLDTEEEAAAAHAVGRGDGAAAGGGGHSSWGYDEKFVWNYHLLMPAFGASVTRSIPHPRNGYGGGAKAAWGAADSDLAASDWVLPLIHGFVDQAKLSVLTRTVYVTLIARRSRHFAGARFLKRGTNEKGQVANDVETEQIVSEALTSPFYVPDAQGIGANPRFTSYVMHRGSIPIFWTQDSTNMSPRPPIEICVVDPYFSAAALHFDDLLGRYGHPIVVLNLIKSKEKQLREVKLLRAFGECVEYLNQFLPQDRKLQYIAWDMSRASKSRDQDVIGVLEDIAEETVSATKFFHTGPALHIPRREGGAGALGYREVMQLQSGVVRVNCVDCLDRTNAAQFVIGKAAFGHQLHALGLLQHPVLPFESDAVDMLTEMYHDLGDTIALQYGGSHLVNTMETYRKINQWTSHSRDMLEGLKRYYANSFIDADKQAAINLFLGVEPDAQDFKPITGFDHSGARIQRRHYQQWFTPRYLEPAAPLEARARRMREVVASERGFWAEYYRPSLFTDFMRHHAFKMTAIHQQQHLIQLRPRQADTDRTGSSASSMHARSSSSLFSASIGSLSEFQSLSGTTAVGTNGASAGPSAAQAPTHAVATTISPFVARRGAGAAHRSAAAAAHTSIGRAATHEDEDDVASGSAAAPASPQARALIGGVRRWMSLRKPEGIRAGTNGSPSSRSRRRASRSASGYLPNEASSGTLAARSSSGDLQDEYESQLSLTDLRDAWPPWERLVAAVTGAGAGASSVSGHDSAKALERMVRRLLEPNVSADEAHEYAKWLDQFREARLDGGEGSVGDAAGEALLEGVAEEDAMVYLEHAAGGRGAGVQAASGALGPGGVDPAIVAYANLTQRLAAGLGAAALTSSATTAGSGVPGAGAFGDAKTKAYAQWLAGGVGRLPDVSTLGNVAGSA